MGRRIPSDVDPLIHSAFSFSLLAAWNIAAAIAIIGALCASRSRKSSSPSKSFPSSQKTAEKTHVVSITTTTTTTTTKVALENSTMERTTPQVQEQKKSPSTPRGKETHGNLLNNSTSRRKLMVSLSMKLPGGAMARYRSQKEEQQQKQELKPENSIWTKTIILGEKCRVPNEEDAIIYDERGNRIAAYPSRAPRSLPVSRTNSFN